jgi:hypothetical protein
MHRDTNMNMVILFIVEQTLIKEFCWVELKLFGNF